jgi:hypothetical protein
VSAQIIAALRRRAKALDKLSKLELSPETIPDAQIFGVVHRLIAQEFRALADDAEGYEPRQGPPFPGSAEPQTGVEQE